MPIRSATVLSIAVITMGLGLKSAIHTASTGMKASEKTINVAGDNLANSNTTGFKAKRADFADFISYTYRLGSTPGMGMSAGTNPHQIGMGVSFAGTTTNFSQGGFRDGMTNTDIAINGNGFLIVQQEGRPNLNYYTRNGALKLNNDLFLTTNTNMYVMGFGINDQFQIQHGAGLTNLRIPIGEMHIAEQTNSVTVAGILNAVGDNATQGRVIQTPPMSDLSKSAPIESEPTIITQLPRPMVEGVTQAAGTISGNMESGTYLYRFVFVDAAGIESDFSAPVNAIVQAGQNAVTLNNLPSIQEGYNALRIYRAVDPNNPTLTPVFHFVADLTGETSFTDSGAVDVTRTLDQGRLGESHQYSYQYYITYFDALGNESRPITIGKPFNINNGQAVLSNLPAVGADNPDNWIGRKIYRSSGSDPTEIRFVGEIRNMEPSATLIDRISDVQLMEQSPVNQAGQGNVQVNQSTLLVDVGRFVNGQFVYTFDPGTLTLTPQKGTQELRPATLEITDSTTVGEYLLFLNEAFGIRSAADGIPLDQGTLGQTINGGSPGAAVIDGAFYILSNAGTANAVEFRADDMRLLTASGDTRLVNLGWGQDPNNRQDALGASVKTDLQVFDSLGAPITVQMTFVLEAKTDTETIYRWFADSSGNQPVDGSAIATGSGIIRFDQHGRLIDATNTTVSIERTHLASVSPLDFDFEMDIGALMALDTNSPNIRQTHQDGAGAGTLFDFQIMPDGIIMGRFSSGVDRPLGQIPLATFRNNEGLYKAGDSLFLQGTNSGDPMINLAGSASGGVGVFRSHSLELSNTDMGAEIINMILASAKYRANAKVMTTSNEMYDALLRIV